MRTIRATVAALFTAITFAVLIAPAPANAQGVYPACYTVSTYGTGTLTPGKVGTGYGTGTLTLNADYKDQYNAVPYDFDYSYINKSSYKSGATSADFYVTMTVNGAGVKVSPHKGYSPGYWLHGTWVGGWRDSIGGWHPWKKGDKVSMRVTVELFPTAHHGYTEGVCVI